MGECYNFDMGSVNNGSDISITLYHALTDGGKFDWAQVQLQDYSTYRWGRVLLQ